MSDIKRRFRSAYDTFSEKNEPTPAGTKIITEHRESITKDGRRELIKDREINIYEQIQASAESCEIQTILRRAAEGDTNILNIVNGQYIDVTGAPSSLAEAQQFVIRAKDEFDKLPKDIRYKFENNAEMYVAEYGTESWQEKTGLSKIKAMQQEEEERNKSLEINMEKAFKNIAEKGIVTNNE